MISLRLFCERISDLACSVCGFLAIILGFRRDYFAVILRECGDGGGEGEMLANFSLACYFSYISSETSKRKNVNKFVFFCRMIIQ